MYRLPEALRPALQTPVGELVGEGELGRCLASADPLIAVGDVTSLTLIDGGHGPKLIIVDFKNERSAWDEADPRYVKLSSYGDEVRNVSNPPATITDELVEAISGALEGRGTCRIEVDGEEDLAVLPCMMHAPLSARIVYGMPGKGLVVVTNDLGMKTWARAFMARMETVR